MVSHICNLPSGVIFSLLKIQSAVIRLLQSFDWQLTEE